MAIGFRDHGLSDLIGFTYRFKSGYDATEHFMQSLQTIAYETQDPTVFVILDGENAWEFFENNAYEFFTTLYEHLASTDWCSTITMEEASQLKSYGTLEKLAPGSWIHGTFDTWSGHPEKNRAWELIYQTRRDVNNFSGSIRDEVAEKIRFHFLTSECSDWFWWYGDDHVTEFSMEFDSLFREHLIEIYRLLEMQPPSNLFDSIVGQKNSTSFWVKPQRSITPDIDGKNSAFCDWLGCGIIDERQMFSTMDRVRGPIDVIRYGHSPSSIFLAFEGDITSLKRDDSFLEITIEESGERLSFALQGEYMDKGDECVIDERVEIALSSVHFQGYDAVHLRFEIVQGKRIVQTMPGFGSLLIDLNETYAHNWFI
jgi:hypothetical protein